MGTPAAYGVTNLVWSDEFSGSNSNVDLTKWNFDLGNSSSIAGSGWGNQEKQTYTNRLSNAYVANGLLHIVTMNDLGGSAPFSSARLQTLNKFSLTYGRVEYRVKCPTHGAYWWPACWMLATNYSGGSNVTNQWPRCGEIDVMESKGSVSNQALGTLHKDSSGNPGVDSPNGGSFTFTGGDSTTNFHTYVVAWSSNSFNFYVASNSFPAEMDFDYVRVYQDVPPLAITGMTPSNGCPAGGTSITISGSNFLSGTTVTIGGIPATSVVLVNTNTITATTPASSSGIVNVAVSAPYISPTGTNTITSTLTNGFTYIVGPSFGGLDNAVPATGAATLSWSAATGSPPISYKVFEATASGAENFASPILTTNSLSAFITPLSLGSNCSTTYYFVVRAVDGCGSSDSNVVEKSVQLVAPGPVFAGLSNATPATEAATLSWSAAQGMSPFTYRVYQATSSGTENFALPVLTTNSLSAFISPLSVGLNCSNTYFFVVRAVDACGSSDSNVIEQSVQPLPTPLVFGGLASATGTVGGASLTWAAAQGAVAPVTYKIYESASSDVSSLTNLVDQTSNLSDTIGTLDPGSNCTNIYYFLVRALDNCNRTDNNQVVLSAQPLGAPPVFAGLGTITAAINAATLSWSAASGSPSLTYNVFKATASGAENFASPLLNTSALSVSVPLYPGSNSPITYFFVVRAQTGCGLSESNAIEQSVQPLLDPNGDQTGNGIPNGWLQQYGFNPFDPSVAAADTDGDGMSNLQEFLAGTDPTNSVSYFHIVSITPQGSDILITWTCGGSRTNVLQGTSDLGINFTDISSNLILSGTGDTPTNYFDAGGVTNTALHFYRVRLAP